MSWQVPYRVPAMQTEVHWSSRDRIQSFYLSFTRTSLSAVPYARCRDHCIGKSVPLDLHRAPLAAAQRAGIHPGRYPLLPRQCRGDSSPSHDSPNFFHRAKTSCPFESADRTSRADYPLLPYLPHLHLLLGSRRRKSIQIFTWRGPR